MDDHELPYRSYLWTVLTTLRTDAWTDLLEYERLARSKENEEDQGELAEVHPEIWDQIIAAPSLLKSKNYDCCFGDHLIQPEEE